MDSFYEREMESFQREMKMRWSKMEIDSFYREHVCDSNLLEFPCPCRICKRMITIDEFNHRLCCTCDRQADIDEGKCSFIIHKSCTKTIPRHIPQHPFHVPQHDFALSSGHHLSSSEHQDICNACGDDLKMGFVYKCSTPHCSFALDVKCAFLTLSNKSIDQHDHPHRLFSCNEGKYFSYSCTCCKLPFTDVDRAETSLLVCLECKALLHKSCAEIPRKIEKHPFHPSLSLDLLPRVPYPGPCFQCNLCRQTKQDGFAYQCVECGIFLDVRCASLKPKKKNGDGDGDDSQQLRHFHPLIVCEDEKNTFPRTCYACGATGHPFHDGDMMYFCPECDCLLDQSCADHFTQDIKHVLHPEHKLTFWYRPLLSGYRKCQACSSSIGDSGYQCFTCAFYLDIKCAVSKPTILHDSADRKPLVLHEAADRKQRCKVCNKRCDTSFFRRLGGDFVVHVDCMTNFPAEIQSSHPHPLTLRGLKEGFQETFFCMVCQKIEGKSPHYSCQKCPTPYNAHPHCVVNEFSEKTTFQYFKDSFNRDQKMEVDSVLQAYGRMDKPNWLYDSHTATKNIRLPNQTLIRTPWEDWDAKSEVIETETGICILKVFAPLLNALVKNYGDFCSGSPLSRLPKMFFVTTVCEVLYNMSITDVKDVTKDMLLTWFQGFALGKHAGLDMAFAFDRLLRVSTTHFGLHAGLFIDPNFAKVGDDEVAERRAPVTHSPIISLGKFELHDELKELGKEREELEKTPKGKRSTYEWKKEWLTDTLDLLREKAFVIPP